MVLIPRNIIKKLYNLTEGQDIHELCYIEVMSDKIIIEGKNAGQKQRNVKMCYIALPARNCIWLRRGAE